MASLTTQMAIRNMGWVMKFSFSPTGRSSRGMSPRCFPAPRVTEAQTSPSPAMTIAMANDMK
jgi:hypothetical protein